jgi:hypothetical protein
MDDRDKMKNGDGNIKGSVCEKSGASFFVAHGAFASCTARNLFTVLGSRDKGGGDARRTREISSYFYSTLSDNTPKLKSELQAMLFT